MDRSTEERASAIPLLHVPLSEAVLKGVLTHPWVLPNTPHSLQEGLFALNEDVLSEAKGVKRGKTFHIAQEMLTTERTYE